MNRFMLATAAIIGLTGSLYAQRAGMNRGGGGAFHAGGGTAAMPQMQRPNPQMQRPPQQMQRPQVSMGGMGGGMNRPMPQINRPMPNMPTAPSLPATLPQVNRPVGGMTPGGGMTRPNISTNPGMTRPSFPSVGDQRPNIPSISTLPGVTKPGMQIPGTRPSLPGETLPGTTRPTLPGIGTTKPLPGVTRPGSGTDLGLDRPIRPTPPGTTPPVTTLPTRPGMGGERPVIRPPTDRPVINRPVIGNNIQQNNIINTRPAWVNVNNVTVNNIHNQWNTAIVNRPGMHNWINNNPNRYNYWHGWGGAVRSNWHYFHHHHDWFGPNWWLVHRPAFCGWHYRYWLPYYPYNYWWSVPTWGGILGWLNWNGAVWQQPIYYDYGIGGNVYLQNGMVTIGGQAVASPSDFSQSAGALATVAPPKSEEAAAAVEWMPLGTFALSTGQNDTEPTRVVQLAVTKDGIIGGTLYNYQTQQSASIQGQVDKATQRIAFRIGDKDNLVAETGLYNLTQKEAPLLMHFGTGGTESYLLIRMENDGEQTR